MAGDGVKTDHSRSARAYLKQPSTWLGLFKVLLGGVLLTKGLDPETTGLIIGAIGVADTVRPEKT